MKTSGYKDQSGPQQEVSFHIFLSFNYSHPQAISGHFLCQLLNHWVQNTIWCVKWTLFSNVVSSLTLGKFLHLNILGALLRNRVCEVLRLGPGIK